MTMLMRDEGAVPMRPHIITVWGMHHALALLTDPSSAL